MAGELVFVPVYLLLFLRRLGGDLDESVVRLIEDGRALLADGEDALVFLALGDGVLSVHSTAGSSTSPVMV